MSIWIDAQGGVAIAILFRYNRGMPDGESKKPRKSGKSKPTATVDHSVPKRVPPYDLGAERALLGALIRQPELYDDVVMVLNNPDDLYFPVWGSKTPRLQAISVV